MLSTAAPPTAPDPIGSAPPAVIRVALLGNPNSGKSTLFNSLTGMRQKVANWPGTTVEYATGTTILGGCALQVTDLPGVYGLTAHAEDERVARSFLMAEQPDIVVVLVDASALERSLFLVIEVAELFPRVVVALNKIDIAEARGFAIEQQALSDRLCAPVVPMCAHRQEGIAHLLPALLAVARKPTEESPGLVPYAGEVMTAVDEISDRLSTNGMVSDPRGKALRLLLGDSDVLRRVRADNRPSSNHSNTSSCCGAEAARFAVESNGLREAAFYLDGLAPRQPALELEIAETRYRWIQDVVAGCVRQVDSTRREWTPAIDRVLLHPFWGYLCLAAVFGAIFWLSFQASAPLTGGLQQVVESLGQATDALLGVLETPDWLRSLALNGAYKGIGSVLAFVPYLAAFFAGMTLLETTGYMVRASLLSDRFMQAAGLHGKSLFPLVSAFGCNVPALAATRTMERPRDRLLTCLVIPFIPCNARLGSMAVVTGAFFKGGTAGLVLLGLILTSLAVVAGASVLYRRTILPSESAPLLLQLSPYTLPRWRDVLIPTLLHLWAFVSRIWKFLLPATVAVWALTYFPVGAPPEASYAASLGGLLAPVGALLGFDWRLMLAILFGFVAKETTLDTLGVVYGMTDDGPLGDALAGSMSPLVALTFLLVYMLYVPCLATVVQMKRETGSAWWTVIGVAFNIALALLLGFAFQRAGLWLGLGA